MPTINEKLLDRYIRHAVYIERFKAGEAKKISQHLSKEVFPKLIDKLIMKIKTTDPSKLKKLWAIKRLKHLTASTDKIIKAGMIKAKDATVDSLMDLAEWETKWNKGLIEKMVPLDIDMTMPNPEVLRQSVLTTPFEGHKLETWFNAYSKSVRTGMMGAVKKGISAGESIPDIARRLQKVTSLKLKQAEYIARTAVSSVTNGAKEAIFAQNKDLVKEIQYVATLDMRTTLICINLDGQVFVVGRGPRPPMHFNCRSTTIPVISSWKEFGIKDPPPATRASMTGKVPAKTTYKTWLRKQSKATQIKVLGKRRAELYHSGKVKIEKFVGKDYMPLTLKQIARREGIEFKPAPPPVGIAPPPKTISKVGTTYAKTTSKDIRKFVDDTIDTYPENVKAALNREGVNYNIGNSLTEINPALKNEYPTGWSKGATWDNVGGMYNINTKTVNVAETYIPRGSKIFEINSKDQIKRILNHETGHAFDNTLGKGFKFYSNQKEFQQAYLKDIAKLSKTTIVDNSIQYYMQAGMRGRSEVFAEVFGVKMGGGARIIDLSKFFPNCAKYVESVLKIKVTPALKKPVTLVSKTKILPAPPPPMKGVNFEAIKKYNMKPTVSTGFSDEQLHLLVENEKLRNAVHFQSLSGRATKAEKILMQKFDFNPVKISGNDNVRYLTSFIENEIRIPKILVKEAVEKQAIVIQRLKKVESNPLSIKASGKKLFEKDIKVIEAFTGENFQNAALWQRSGTVRYGNIIDVKKSIGRIEKVLEKLPGYKGTTYRGIAFKTETERQGFLSQFKKGNIFTSKTFQSTSIKKSVANRFIRESEFGRKGIVLNIEGKTGRNITKYSVHPEEAEVLFKANTSFKVIRIEDNNIFLREI